ncbi:MAG: molybdenum cofactor biosynthesis protein MoaE [Puniceicoccaceae bacterium]
MIEIHLIEQAIESYESPATVEAVSGHGALVEFAGVIRPEEQGSQISGIRYEAYTAMAENVMRERLEVLQQKHGFLAAEVIHRIGSVDVGCQAIRVRIWSAHRKEAFAALIAFMDELKQEVPIWKVATY